MTDLELTKRAFSAAFHGADLMEDKDMLEKWKPLESDSDALRIACLFCMDIITGPCIAHVSSPKGALNGIFTKECTTTKSQVSAVRRAIVRHAAALGEIE